jgi:hypothetical protein
MSNFRIGSRVRPKPGVLPHHPGGRDWNNPDYELTIVDIRHNSLWLKVAGLRINGFAGNPPQTSRFLSHKKPAIAGG